MTTTSRWTVTGMTCGHCEAAVREEISRLDGVSSVEVDLVAGGESVVSVTSEAPLSETTVREAVDEAGYVLVGGAT